MADPAVVRELVPDLSSRELAAALKISPVTAVRLVRGLPVQPRIVRLLAEFVDRRHQSPTVARLLGRRAGQ